MSANAAPRRAPGAGDEYRDLAPFRESAASPCRCGYLLASTPHTTCICTPNTTFLNPYPTPPPTGRHGALTNGSPPSEKLSINYLLQGGKPPTPDSPSSRRGHSSRGSDLPASVLAQLSSAQNRSRHRCYHLEVVQHPLTAAEYGNSTLSRLPISPPMVVQLIVKDGAGNIAQDESEIPFLVCHLSLAAADNSSSGASGAHRLLYGTLVSSPHRLRNVDGKPGVFFIFPDVSIRQRGRYRLGVTLINIMNGLGPAPPGGSTGGGSGGNVLASAWSASFYVVPLSEYTAPAQTPLTQSFVRQGAQMYAFATPTSSSRPLG